MSDRSKHSTFSRYAKGLLSRPTTGGSHDNRSIRSDLNDFGNPKESTQNLCYVADSAINAFAPNPENTKVALAGREILKVLSIRQDEIVEISDLRGGSRVNLNYSSNDVKWGIGASAAIVATATSNGSIVTWNVHTGSKRVERAINGHNRAVNRLAFNPGNGSWLLSASQDGSMRLWDLRERDGTARFIMHGKAEAVRDVQFNSINAVELAAVYDNGALQKWDLRNSKIYERKFSAHQGPALSLNWHADGRHLVTGGRDKLIKIWDMSSDTRRPVSDLHTMAPVARVAWRPGDTAKNCQIASCSFSMDNHIVLWNLRRPYLPGRIFDAHDAVATGILWKDADSLWSCSKDQTFRQHAVALAYRPTNLLSHSAFGWSTSGDIALCIGDPVADLASFQSKQQRIVLDHGVHSHAIAMTTGGKECRSPEEMPPHSFDPRLETFKPVQSFAIVAAEDDNTKLFIHLARTYVCSRNDPIRACAENAMIAHKADQRHLSKSWKLIKLELEHIERIKHKLVVPRTVPSRSTSLSRSKVGESLIRRDLERLRNTPGLSESGYSTIRTNSPASSFIMPRYSDVSVPPLSLSSPATPSRPRTADSTIPRSSSSNLPVKSDEELVRDKPNKVNLPVLADFENSKHRQSSASRGPEHLETLQEVTRVPAESNSSHQAIPGAAHGQFEPFRENCSETQKSNDVATQEARRSTLSAGHDSEFSESHFQRLYDTVNQTLNHFRELGDVQTCATICLVLADQMTLDTKLVDDWLFCYTDLLRRHRLFTVIAEVINNTTSEFIKSMAEGDLITSTSCGRCRKAVPLIREGEGNNWTCSRCRNFARCILCLTAIKGEASWCPSCTHTAHPACRSMLIAEFSGRCVAPNCDCRCNTDGKP